MLHVPVREHINVASTKAVILVKISNDPLTGLLLE